MSRELAKDVSADLVAFPANRGAKVETELAGGETAVRQRLDATLDDAGGGATPTRVQQRNGTRRVRHENRDAVGHGYCQGEAAFRCNMPVGGVDAEPPFPAITMGNDARAVHLIGGGESDSVGGQLLAELAPSLHNEASRLVGGQAEGSRRTCGRERADPERREIVDALGVGDDRHVCRRSSMRSILAPSARRRSSMRS